MNLWRHLLLLTGVCALGLSAPAIRWAAAPPLAIVVWRLVLSLPLLAAATVVKRERWPVRGALLGGTFLAAYLVLWVSAVQTTTITRAALLVCTGPLWSALLSRPLLDERIARQQWVGLLVALVGTGVVLSTATAGEQGRDLAGDIRALGASWAWVGYTFAGRRARRTAGFSGYTAALYATAAIGVAVAALCQRVPLFGYSVRTWVALGALALFPTLIGHGSFNYLLRFIDPTRLSLWLLGKPLVAAVLGWALFGEAPALAVLAGGPVVLAGIAAGITAPAVQVAGRPARSATASRVA